MFPKRVRPSGFPDFQKESATHPLFVEIASFFSRQGKDFFHLSVEDSRPARVRVPGAEAVLP
jgi:hypothetical protein